MSVRRHWSINGRFVAQPQTGVQRYAGEITRAIDTRLATDDALARTTTWDICLPADAPDITHLQAIDIRRSSIGRGYAWEQVVLPTMARGGLLSLANLGPLAHARQIVCLHDANVAIEPSSYSRSFRMAYRTLLPLLARRATAVTTVSGFSAQMLASFKITGRMPAHVISNGHEHALRWHAEASRFSAPEAFVRPFVFALGSRAKHKQIDLLLGLAPALDAMGIDLVISGGGASIFAQTTMDAAPNVHSVGFVSDDDLAALFSRALCFAFPSRTEGFGLPLLEAMVHGAPILASDCASMPEVCGDAALYAGPNDSAAWLDGIKRLSSSAELRADLVQRGKLRYRQFSWARSADVYIDLVQGLSVLQRSAAQPSPIVSPFRRTVR